MNLCQETGGIIKVSSKKVDHYIANFTRRRKIDSCLKSWLQSYRSTVLMSAKSRKLHSSNVRAIETLRVPIALLLDTGLHQN